MIRVFSPAFSLQTDSDACLPHAGLPQLVRVGELHCACLFVFAEDSLLRQDDIWMLDGDDPQEPPSRAPRPDHLDFLRITPPEDDIIGDTPYCPKLECTVSGNKDEV